MTSDEIFDVIEEIAACSSKTDKQVIIQAHSHDEDFKRVLTYALDSFRTFGLAKRPGAVDMGIAARFDAGVWSLLDQLANRTLSGNAAKDAVSTELSRLTDKSGELLWRIISKDLRAGFSESTVNKAIPGLIPTFDCMLAHKFEAKRIKKWPVVAEPKLDGVRVLCFVFEDGRIQFFSRSGKEFTTFEALKPHITYLVQQANWTGHNFVLDGEVVSGSFNKTVSEVRRKDAQATDAEFHVFDLLPAQVFAGVPSTRPYASRREILEGFVSGLAGPIKTIPRYLVSSEHEIHRLYEAVRARGLEGLIIKDPDAPYVTKRNHAWMKLKNESEVDVPVVDFEEGTGKYEGVLGALVVDFNGIRVNVGTGLSDDQRREIWEDRHTLTGELCTVEYHEVTPDGSLRHPRFVKWRPDKPAKDGIGC